MNDSADYDHLATAARRLLGYRAERARSRSHARAILDAMAAEAQRYLGAVFTTNDVISNLPVALVVRSDERLPDDYEAQTPRPSTDTLNRLIVEVLGRAITIEITDAGVVSASGDARHSSLDRVTGARIARDELDGSTFLLVRGDDSGSDIPFVRVLADLIETASEGEAHFAHSAAAKTSQPATVA